MNVLATRDLVELIMDHLVDSPSVLTQCAQVNNLFPQVSVPRLYQNLELSYEGKPPLLEVILAHSSHLLHFVRHLTVMSSTRFSFAVLSVLLTRLTQHLVAFGKLQTLSFFSFSGYSIILPLLQMPSLESFDTRIIRPPRDARFEHFFEHRKLRMLTLERFALHNNPVLGSGKQLRLKGLGFYICSKTIVDWPFLPKLTNLQELDQLAIRIYPDLAPNELEKVPPIFEVMESLTHLWISVTAPRMYWDTLFENRNEVHDPLLVFFNGLHLCHSLRHLSLTIPHDSKPDVGDTLQLAEDIIRLVSKRAQLRSVSFYPATHFPFSSHRLRGFTLAGPGFAEHPSGNLHAPVNTIKEHFPKCDICLYGSAPTTGSSC